MNKNLLVSAIKVTMPVFFGYISIGIPFGLLVVHAGYPWWLSPLMGISMFTGAGQFFAVALFSTGAMLSVIVLAEFLLSIRHIFYGLSLIGTYKPLGPYRPYLMYSITDETFALVSTIQVPKGMDSGKFYTMISLLDHCYWVTGSLIGAAAYKILQAWNLTQYLAGVDYALTSLFVVLAVEQIISRKDFLGPFTGAAISAICVILFKLGRFNSSNIIWVAICLGLLLLFIMRGKSYYRNSHTADGIIPSEKKDSISLPGTIAAIMIFAIFAFFMINFSKASSLADSGTEPLTLKNALIAVFASGAVVLATRILPFAIFAKKNPPLFVRFVERYAPPLIMTVLLVYCFKDADYSSGATYIPYFACAVLAALIQIKSRNSMASILGSTIPYMILMRIFQ